MQCPRCHAEAKIFSNQGISVEVCSEGCGGIWFDWQELRKMDESHEVDPEFIAKLGQNKMKQLPLAERLECPMCIDTIMMRRFWSVKRQLEIDECPKCGGIWLDAGELTHIHSEFKSEGDRQKATDQFINDMFGNALNEEKKSSEERAATMHKVGSALRFLGAPSRLLRTRKF